MINLRLNLVLKTLIIFYLLIFLSACHSPGEGKSIVKNSSIFQEAEVTQIMVTTDDAAIYPGVNKELPILTNIPKHQVFDVVGRTQDWYIVILADARVGCIEKSAVVPYIEGKNVEKNKELIKALYPEEQLMLNLINGERSQAGLEPLKLDLELTELARLKSEDLIHYNYFSHYSPSYGSPFEMLERYHISYVFAGENLAGNKNVKKAHQELMNSATHRQNILNPAFTHVGIGMGKGGSYGNIFTQLYIGR